MGEMGAVVDKYSRTVARETKFGETLKIELEQNAVLDLDWKDVKLS